MRLARHFSWLVLSSFRSSCPLCLVVLFRVLVPCWLAGLWMWPRAPEEVFVIGPLTSAPNCYSKEQQLCNIDYIKKVLGPVLACRPYCRTAHPSASKACQAVHYTGPRFPPASSRVRLKRCWLHLHPGVVEWLLRRRWRHLPLTLLAVQCSGSQGAGCGADRCRVGQLFSLEFRTAQPRLPLASDFLAAASTAAETVRLVGTAVNVPPHEELHT